MSARSRNDGSGQTVIVTLSNVSHMTLSPAGQVHRNSQVEHELTLDEARRLRDDLTREIERGTL